MPTTVPRDPPTRLPVSRRAQALSSSRLRDLLRLTERPDLLSLAGGLPAGDHLPADAVRAVVDRVLDATGPYGARALQYGPTEGIDELRSAIGERGGVDAARVVVTTGSQQGLDLLARAVADPGDVVAVPVPAYLGALQAFGAAGATLLGVPSDEHGVDTDALAATLRAGARPVACYVVADFANPTGTVMPAERRGQLVTLARHYGFVVIEDDPYGELRFSGDALPPVAAGADDVVVRLGTASKTLAPGLRVGWLAAPAPLVGPVVRMKQAADLHTSTLTQAVVAALWADADGYADHLGRLRATYAARATALVEALQAETGDRLEVARPDGGLFCWARLTDPGGSAEALLHRAVGRGVAFVPGAAFVPPGSAFSATDRLRLSFASLPPGLLAEAARRLAVAIRRPDESRGA